MSDISNLPSLPIELQLEILKQTDPDTIINFCSNQKDKELDYNLRNVCDDVFKFLLKESGFTNFDTFTKNYHQIYPDLYYCFIMSFTSRDIKAGNCFNPMFVKCLLQKKSYQAIKFLQSQNSYSVEFDMTFDKTFSLPSDDEEFEDEANSIYNNSFLKSVCPLKRGDVLTFKVDSYVNYGKFIFDGQKLSVVNNNPVNLYVINEFPINYFYFSLPHNKVLSNIKDVTLKELSKGKLHYHKFKVFSFDINNSKYALLVYVHRKNKIEIDNDSVTSLIKTNESYEAGLSQFTFQSDEIKFIYDILKKFDIPNNNLLSLNLYPEDEEN